MSPQEVQCNTMISQSKHMAGNPSQTPAEGKAKVLKYKKDCIIICGPFEQATKNEEPKKR